MILCSSLILIITEYGIIIIKTAKERTSKTRSTMQQSYLQQSDSQQYQQTPSNQIPYPNRRMFAIQFPFVQSLLQQAKTVQQGIQQLLVQLSKCQEGNQKKRLPYTILRGFEKYVKEIRKLKLSILASNRQYGLYLQNREKNKAEKNIEFKKYLKQLGVKREELKNYMNKVQGRVRKLQDSGYAQFVEYDVVVKEINTIRFSYCQKILLGLVWNRQEKTQMVIRQIAKRMQLLKKMTQTKINKNQQQGTNNETQQKPANLQNQSIAKSIPILTSPNTSLQLCLLIYRTSKYLQNTKIFCFKHLSFAQKVQQHKIEIEKLKISLKQNQQLIFKIKLKNGISSQDPTYTRTDQLIYLKQMQAQIKSRVENRIFYWKEMPKIGRSKSSPPGPLEKN